MDDPPETPDDDAEDKVRRSLQSLSELGRYEIRDLLGEGATAIVYRGWDCTLNRPVAIKVLRDIVAFSGVARERFRREGQTAAGISHPNVVLVHDAGEAGGHLYHVMELVEGQTLAQVLAGSKRPWRELLQLLVKTARGVGEAHRKGIVHRDLKPGNIFVTRADEPKVGDFGLAHLADLEGSLTRTGTPLGTPLYMAPELVRGAVKEVSPRTDVYALGAMLYEMLTGATPHAGAHVLEIYRAILEDEPSVGRLRTMGVPPELEAIALRALEKKPAQRYADADAFADDLARFLAGEPIVARPPSATARFVRRARKHRLPVAALAAGLLLASGVFWAITAARPPAVPLPIEVPAPVPSAPPRAPVVARVASIVGEAQAISSRGRRPASPNEELAVGEGLATLGLSSRAVVKYPDGVELDMGGDAEVARLDVDGPGGARTVQLANGAVTTTLPGTTIPILISTPIGEIHAPRGVFTVAVRPAGVRIEVRHGWARVTRMRDGATVVVTEALALDLTVDQSLVAQPLAVPSAYNMVLNGGFEQDADGDGAADHWSRDLGVLDRTDVHDGKASLRVEATGKPEYTYQKFLVAPTTEYRLTGWVKTEGVKGIGARVRFVPLESKGQLTRGTPYATGTGDWKRISVVFRTAADAKEARVDVEFTATEGRAWLDDIELVPTAAVPPK